MRSVIPLLFVLSATLPLGLSAADPAQVDASKRNTQLAPQPDAPLSPRRESNQRTFFRNDHVQDQRFRAPETLERKNAAVGDRRAPIDINETREKTIVDRKEFPKPDVRDRKVNRHNRSRSHIQAEGDQLRKFDLVDKYRQRMADADAAAAWREPKLEKRTTFEKLNRFAYKRNGPGTEGGNPVVTPAAGGEPPPSQDTHTVYQVDWRRFAPESR